MPNVLGALSKFSVSFFSGVVVGLPIYITITDCLFCVARVEGTSMQPTLNPKYKEKSDVVFLDKWNVSVDKVNRGDIVAIASPHNQNVSFVKRIIGLEGDVVKTPRYNHSYVFVPRGHCWIEGDNSKSSLDSNSFGPVSLGLIRGKATHIVWPPKRWQKLDQSPPTNRDPINLKKFSKKVKTQVIEVDDNGDNRKEANITISVEFEDPTVSVPFADKE